MNQIFFSLSMPLDFEFSYNWNFRSVVDAVTRAGAPAPHWA
jgi:hypothetical protein